MMSNIFNIFSIDWWMDESNNALQMTDSVLFLLLAIPVAYLFLCALFSLGKYKNPYPAAAVQHRFLVLFTVLRNGKEVIAKIGISSTVRRISWQICTPSASDNDISMSNIWGRVCELLHNSAAFLPSVHRHKIFSSPNR